MEGICTDFVGGGKQESEGEEDEEEMGEVI